jgi:hypothetical protein
MDRLIRELVDLPERFHRFDFVPNSVDDIELDI